MMQSFPPICQHRRHEILEVTSLPIQSYPSHWLRFVFEFLRANVGLERRRGPSAVKSLSSRLS